MSFRVFMLLALCISLLAGTCTKVDPACERGYNDGCTAAYYSDPPTDFESSTYEDCYLRGYEDCSEADMTASTEPIDTEEEADAPSTAPLGR